MKKSKKLMWKIFGFLISFCLILLVVLWIMEVILLDTMYKNIRKEEIKKAITLVEENIDNPDLKEIIMKLQEDLEIIVSPAHSFVTPKGPDPNDRPPLRQAITQRKDFTRSDGKRVSFVFYAIISPVNATVSTIKVQLYYVTGIMIFLSVILAFIIAKTVSKPIEELNNSAKFLANGDYKIHFTGKGYREIHELSDTLNVTTYELSKVEGLRRELMANISHDLRTPLSLIYSYAEMMHDFPKEITKEQTQVIMDESKRLSILVSDILDLSQLEIGTMELNIKEYNITKSIIAIIDRISELVRKDGYSISFEKDKDIYVKADEVQITQGIYNLLINAIHYCGDDLKVVVRQIAYNNRVKIEVEDHGLGIEEKDIPYIWDRYYKLDKEHRRAIIGTGLGLSIVKKIIKMHCGEYGVYSEVGKGSRFWFSLKISS